MGIFRLSKMEDYYTTLGLTKSASIADVTSSFRKLALKHHPDRNPEDQLASKAKLDQICESYDVLSNREPLLRVCLMLTSVFCSNVQSRIRPTRQAGAQQRCRRWEGRQC